METTVNLGPSHFASIDLVVVEMSELAAQQVDNLNLYDMICTAAEQHAH